MCGLALSQLLLELSHIIDPNTLRTRPLSTHTSRKHLAETMSLPQENIRALDQLRQRLQQLSTSLNILKTDLSRQETLPTW